MLRHLSFLLIADVALGQFLDVPSDPLAACEADRAKLVRRLQEMGAVPDLTENLSVGKVPFNTSSFWSICGMVVFVITIQSLANGLTMGLVSIDPIDLEVIIKKEDHDFFDPKEREQLRRDKESAQKVLPLIKDHHLLMVTVLLVNCICGEVLPLFLDRLVPSWASLLLSVTLVLMFSEVIPSAIFTGSRQLILAAQFSPLVVLWRFMFFPIALPIARLLDCLLGVEHKGRYNFAELRAIVAMHSKHGTGGEHEAVFKFHDDQGLGIITTEKPHRFTSESAVIFTENEDVQAVSKNLSKDAIYYVKTCPPLYGRNMHCTFQLFPTAEKRVPLKFREGDLTSGIFKLQERDEIKIAQGAMLLSHASAGEHLARDEAVTLDRAYMLDYHQQLSSDKLAELDQQGYSRIPVYEGDKHNVRGFILTRGIMRLMCNNMNRIDKLDQLILVSNLEVKPMIVISPDTNMLDLLNKFQEEKKHLALVTNDTRAVDKAWSNNTIIPPHVHMMGIITLEDVIERLLQEKIDDEYDDEKCDLVANFSCMLTTDLSTNSLARRVSDSRDQAKRVSGGVKTYQRSDTWTGHLSQPLLPQ